MICGTPRAAKVGISATHVLRLLDDQPVGGGRRVLRIALVVLEDQLELHHLVSDLEAAGIVDDLGRHLRTRLGPLAFVRCPAGQRE
jgi:hypothetical protein